MLPPPRGRPPPIGDCGWPRGQGALRRRSPWGWRCNRPPTRSRPPSSMSRADGMPSRPRPRRTQASYRDGDRRLVPAEPLRPREGTRWRTRGDSAGSLRRRGTNSRSGPSKSSSSQSSRTSTGSLDGSRRASACSRVVLPAPVMPVTRTLPRWLRHGPQASSTPGGHAPIPKRSLDALVAIEHTLGARHPTGKHFRSPNASALDVPHPEPPHGAQPVISGPGTRPGRRAIQRSNTKSSPATSGMAG